MPLSTINSNSFSSTANTNIDNGNLFIDAINNRIGMGTTGPAQKLDVSGVIQTLTTLQSSSGADLTLNANGANRDVFLKVNGTTIATAVGSTSNFQFNSGYGSVATAYGCRAWVNFNGTGTVAIRGSGNVSSITDRGTGQYHINFTTALPDVNYSVNGSAIGSPDSWSGVTIVGANNSDTSTYGMKTTGVSVILTDVYSPNGYPNRDMSVVSLHIFR